MMSIKVDERIVAIAKALNASPAQIADMWGLSPVRIERLMVSRYQPIRDGETVLEAVKRYYGESVIRLIEHYYQADAKFAFTKGGAE